MNFRIPTSLLALIATQAFAVAARAEPAKNDSPAALVKAGDDKAASGDCEQALKSYRDAEAAKPSAEAEWGMASCEDKLGRAHPAVEAYEKFLAHGTIALGPKLAAHADEAKTRIEALRQTPGSIHVETVPADATVTVDSVPATSHDLQLKPGPHLIRVTASSYESTQVDLEVFYGMKRKISVELHALPAPPPPPPAPEPAAVEPPPPVAPPPAEEPSGVSRQTVALVAGGGAIVGFGLGAVFGGIALHQKSEFDNHPTLGHADNATDFAIYSDIALGAGVLLGLTSATLFLMGHDQAAAAVSSHVSSGKAGSSFLLHF